MLFGALMKEYRTVDTEYERITFPLMYFERKNSSIQVKSLVYPKLVFLIIENSTQINPQTALSPKILL